jgi:hypothetical protein
MHKADRQRRRVPPARVIVALKLAGPSAQARICFCMVAFVQREHPAVLIERAAPGEDAVDCDRRFHAPLNLSIDGDGNAADGLHHLLELPGV